MKQLAFAIICGLISKQHTEVDKAIAFIESVAEKKERLGDEAFLYCQNVTAQCVFIVCFVFCAVVEPVFVFGSLKLAQGKSEEVKPMIEAGAKALEGMQAADPVIHSSYYKAASEYYKVSK